MMVLRALGEIFLTSSFLPEIELQPAQPNTKNMKEWLIPHYRRAFPKSEDDRPEVFR